MKPRWFAFQLSRKDLSRPRERLSRKIYDLTWYLPSWLPQVSQIWRQTLIFIEKEGSDVQNKNVKCIQHWKTYRDSPIMHPSYDQKEISKENYLTKTCSKHPSISYEVFYNPQSLFLFIDLRTTISKELVCNDIVSIRTQRYPTTLY